MRATKASKTKMKYGHIDIVVRNLDEAEDYFAKVLEWEPAKETLVFDEPGFKVRYRRMLTGDGNKVILVEPKEGPLVKIIKDHGEGTIFRLAFTVGDIEKSYDELKEKGVTPLDLFESPLVGKKYHYVPRAGKLLLLPRKLKNLSIELIEQAKD